MIQTEDNTQTILLQKCKETIQTLHQEMIHQQITNELLAAEKDNLKKMIEEKDKIIFELQDRINQLLNRGTLEESQYGDIHQSKLDIIRKYDQLLAENKELRKQLDNHSRIDKKDVGIKSISIKNMDSGLFCSQALDIDQSQQISVTDMLASDKKILIYLVKQKDKQIDRMISQNRKLKEQKDKLNRYCKNILRRIDSQYQMPYIGITEDSISQVLCTPRSNRYSRQRLECEEQKSLRKSNNFTNRHILSKSKSIKKSQTPTIKTPRKHITLQSSHPQKQSFYSPQHYYYRKTQG